MGRTQRIAQAAKQVLDTPRDATGLARRAPYSGDAHTMFLGVVKTAGPNGEADTTDARYWVKEVSTAAATLWQETVGGLWVQVYNLPEIGAACSATGSHLLLKVPSYATPATKRIVQCTFFNEIWVMDTYPAQMVGTYNIGYSIRDATTSCPKTWKHVRMCGPSYLQDEQPPTG